MFYCAHFNLQDCVLPGNQVPKNATIPRPDKANMGVIKVSRNDKLVYSTLFVIYNVFGPILYT